MTSLTSVGSALLAFGAILTSVSAMAGTGVAACGAAWEGYVFFRAGGR